MKELLEKHLQVAQDDLALMDGGDASFHYYEGLIDGLKICLSELEREGK